MMTPAELFDKAKDAKTPIGVVLFLVGAVYATAESATAMTANHTSRLKRIMTFVLNIFASVFTVSGAPGSTNGWRRSSTFRLLPRGSGPALA